MLRPEVTAEIARLSEEEDHERMKRIVSAVEEIRASYGLNNTELSQALGFYIPPRGRGGSCAVTSWLRGYQKPSRFNVVLIEEVAFGSRFSVKLVGKEGRRYIFELCLRANGEVSE